MNGNAPFTGVLPGFIYSFTDSLRRFARGIYRLFLTKKSMEIRKTLWSIRSDESNWRGKMHTEMVSVAEYRSPFV